MTDEQSRLVILANAVNRNSPLGQKLSEHFNLLEATSFEKVKKFDWANDPETCVLCSAGILQSLSSTPDGLVTGSILDVIGEGVSVCNATGTLIWANPKFHQFPAAVRKRVQITCTEAARYYTERPDRDANWSRKFNFQCGEDQFYEMIVSPVEWGDQPDTTDETYTPAEPTGVHMAAIIWDNSYGHRLQQQLDAIDLAGSELVRIEAEAVSSFNAAQRLALLEDKVIKYTRDLMNFDHFNVFLLEKKSNRLQPLMAVGMPNEITDYELYSSTTGSGICGFVAASAKSYICHDVQNDPRYLAGLENAASSLSVPLRLHDEVIGVFNVESARPGNFSEDDRQFAEIFGRYIALALNILDLLIVERCTTSGTVAVNVIGEISKPLSDICSDATALREKFGDDPEAERLINLILDHVNQVRERAQEVARGPRNILGIQDATEETHLDPLFADRHILVADDEPNIINTIKPILVKRGCRVTTADCGTKAIKHLETSDPNEFDLILSDISMDDRNGYEVFAASRRINPDTPVILMTGFGYDPHHSIVRASQEGLQCVLFKPFQVTHLLDEITKALRKNTESDPAQDNEPRT